MDFFPFSFSLHGVDPGRKLAYLTPPKSLVSGTPHSRSSSTSPSTVATGTTPSPSSLRTTLTLSWCRWVRPLLNDHVDMKGNWAQARGAERPDGNATLVGEWKKKPGITKHLKCIGTHRSTWVNVKRFYQYCKASGIFISWRVTDKGRPVLLGNMTFTWTAPSSDYGPIRYLNQFQQ